MQYIEEINKKGYDTAKSERFQRPSFPKVVENGRRAI